MKQPFLTIAVLGAMLASCGGTAPEHTLTRSGLDPENFADTIDCKPVKLYVLTNSGDMEACITNYGGRVVSLMVPDSRDSLRDVVLGHSRIDDYINIDGNFGAIIGRYGNRINHGRFTLDSIARQLPQNDFGHCLHGGPMGFHHQVFDAEQPNDSTLVLRYTSPAGDWGFPGKLDATVTYTLAANDLRIDYAAVTDQPTIINLTNHSYFNLSGNHSHDILDETVWIDADRYTPIDSTFMPLGELASVEGTPFDFNTPHTIRALLDEINPQLKNGRGYDHNMVLRADRDLAAPVARVTDPESGITMEIITDQPGIQFYIGNFLDGTVRGKNGTFYPHRAALCLETQHYPDSPNHPEWPTTVLRPADKYATSTTYRFSH